MALDHGLLLVDTKYEFGKGPDGAILLIDEVGSHYFNASFAAELVSSSCRIWIL